MWRLNYSITTHSLPAEYNLWLDVLKLAIDDALGGNDLMQRRALTWINSNAEHVGSCRYVCDLLGADQRTIRTILEAAKSQPKKRRRKRVQR